MIKLLRVYSILFLILQTAVVVAQKNLLQSGPMVGYCEMKEALIWAQTKSEATLHIQYYALNDPKTVFTSDKVTTEKAHAFTAKIILDQLKAGQRYHYDLYINNQKVSLPYKTEFQSKALWQWRTDAPDFSVAMGSCNYINEPELDRPGRGYGDSYRIFESIHHKQPDMMLWLGDNTYLREADWDSKTGIYHRNTHSRAIPELQPLLGSTMNIAIWDDHDFGPNDSDGSFYNKHLAQQAFKDFWGNKTFGLDKSQEQGITSIFSWGDADFFLLDNRFFRSSNERKTGTRTILGNEQFEWLINALASSKAAFKFICIGGQVVNSAARFENYATFPEERQHLFDEIQQNNIKGVIFLTGDRHHSELSALQRPNDYPIYDWTVSPLTSGVAKSADQDNNINSVPGSLVQERNFGMLYFSGKKEDRQVKMVLYDTDGVSIWTKTLYLKDLK